MVEATDVSSVVDPVARVVVVSCAEVLVDCSTLLTLVDGSTNDVLSATIEFTEVSEVCWSISVVVVDGAMAAVDMGDGCTSTVDVVTDIDDVIGCVSTDDVEGCGVGSLVAVLDGAIDVGDGSTLDAVTDIDDVIGSVSMDDVEGCGVGSLVAVLDGVTTSDDASITMLVGSTVVVIGNICCSILDVTADVEVGNISSLVIAVDSSELSITSRIVVSSAMTDVGVGSTDDS